jgi:hypothetical protein
MEIQPLTRLRSAPGALRISVMKQVTLTWVILWAGIGTVLFFCIYGVLARTEAPLGTFLAASVGGAVGIWFCGRWMKGLPRGRWGRKAILIAYCARIVVGLVVYLSVQDPNYFNSSGSYVAQTPEYEWTYEQAKFAADHIEGTGELGSRAVFLVDRDKNANIHTWMGWFFAVGDSRNSLDLAPFNAFHHALAGILICGIGIELGYSVSLSILAGVVTAWIPWAFPASLMWRDSVGLAWIVAALAILIVSRRFGIIGVLIGCIPAGLLLYSDRQPYFVLPLFFLMFYLFDRYNLNLSLKRNNYKNLIIIVVFFIGYVLMIERIDSVFLFRYHDFLSNLSERIIDIPLLLIRAIMGPFPWDIQSRFDFYTCFDYIFHVFQLGIFFVVFRNIRRFLNEIDIMCFFGIAIWIIGLVATGVHTAYLAAGIPFILPKVFSIKSKIIPELILASFIFIFLNCLYELSGLHGSGFLMKMTGY